MTTPVIKNFIGRARTENCAARAARTLEQFRAVLCKKKKKKKKKKGKRKRNKQQQQKTTWNYHIEGYDDNLNIQLYMCAHTSLVLAHFINIVECKQVG